MKFLIKNAKIVDRNSNYFNQIKDVLIEDNLIKAIDSEIEDSEAQIIKYDNLHLSIGWVDLKADFCEPGMEHKESIDSGLTAAAAGGFTHVAIVPSTKPVIDNKAQVEYALRKAENHVSQIYILGAITENLKGEAMAEMFDMKQSGASYFTDDLHALNAGIIHRALLYTKDFNTKIAVFPRDKSLSEGTQVNEGNASTLTGLKADPRVSEIIDLHKYINLAEYTDGNIHITGISTKESVDLIKNAKNKGVNITSEVHVEQLIFTENDVTNFDVNYKLLPVLRENEDKIALWEGLKDGTIDGIASNHRPADTEEKFLEFDYANFGNITLQTFFSSLLNETNDLQLIIDILSNRNREILEVEQTSINIGNTADITLFDPTKKWIFNKESNYSLSNNSPFFNKELTGFVYGVMNKGKVLLKEI